MQIYTPRQTQDNKHLLESKKTICVVFHDHCSDGSAAAWAAKQALADKKDVEFFADQYGRYALDIPSCKGKDVLIVDFSYPKDKMTALSSVANSVTVLDHHKKARDVLAPLLESGEILGEFDMTRAGCLMTWDFFFDGEAPALIQHASDRDLWQFKLPKTKEIIAAAMAEGFDLDVWEVLMSTPIEELAEKGDSICKARTKEMTDHISASMFRMKICGYVVPVIFSPYSWASDICELIYSKEDVPFVVSVNYRGHAAGLSFRKKKGGSVDLNELASKFGGGGHVDAAGGRVSSLTELGRVIPKRPTSFKDKAYKALGLNKGKAW